MIISYNKRWTKGHNVNGEFLVLLEVIRKCIESRIGFQLEFNTPNQYNITGRDERFKSILKEARSILVQQPQGPALISQTNGMEAE